MDSAFEMQAQLPFPIYFFENFCTFGHMNQLLESDFRPKKRMFWRSSSVILKWMCCFWTRWKGADLVGTVLCRHLMSYIIYTAECCPGCNLCSIVQLIHFQVPNWTCLKGPFCDPQPHFPIFVKKKKKIEIFTSGEAFRYIIFVLKIHWWNNHKLLNYYCDKVIPFIE